MQRNEEYSAFLVIQEIQIKVLMHDFFSCYLIGKMFFKIGILMEAR